MIEINLLEQGRKKGKEKKTISVGLPNVVLIAIVVVIVEVVVLFVVSFSMNRTIDKLEEQRRSLSNIERQVKHYQAKMREVQNMIKAVKSLEKGRNKAVIILEEVADAIPNAGFTYGSGSIVSLAGSLWLTKVTKKGNTLNLDGKSFSAEAVADYMMRLSALKDVKSVRFSRGGLRKISKYGSTDVYSFSLVVTLR